MVADPEAARREVSEGLRTIGRIRVVASLARNQDRTLTRYALVSETGLKRRDVQENLRRLVAIGWVVEYRAGSVKMYGFNWGNERARLFAEFLGKVGYLST